MPEESVAEWKSKLPIAISGYDGWTFTPGSAEFTLKDHFKTQSLEGFGLGASPLAMGAAGGLLHYVSQELRRTVSHLRNLATFQREDVLVLDQVTRKNLDLVESARGSAVNTTLLGAVDRTITAGGGRLLRQWVLEPLRSRDRIRERQTAVGYWKEHELEREALREKLRGVKDLERLIGRLSQGAGNARDLVALKFSLSQIPAVKALLVDHPLPFISQFAAGLIEQPELVDMLETALVEEPPMTIKEGGLIKPGHHAELDDLRSASTKGKEWLAELQTREQERTGIKSLKVRYNQVFGYYIEITRSNLQAVPADYTRKQTMVNAERFITPELKQMEEKILGAEERSRQLEYDLFLQLREAALACTEAIQKAAQTLSRLDVLSAWGRLAQEQGYQRPEVEEGGRLEIEEGRHPVLEQLIQGERFVPNDTLLDSESARLMILTGPNMAGKSTYIRQVALLSILAHCGCYVPAKRMQCGVLDRIFTRVGANDDLSRGQSTFMVEMNETANILNHATADSLVILDEIGRGTSTFDGLSIAWAVAEHLHSKIRAKTLFATHYHELTELAVALPAVKNYNVAVREWNDQIIFLRKIVAGGTDKSYGIQVARLAGLPVSVIFRAKEVLRNLEEGELDETGQPRLTKSVKKKPKTTTKKQKEEPPEMDLFKAGFNF
jgi:DNA mismatch repair protein MutS